MSLKIKTAIQFLKKHRVIILIWGVALFLRVYQIDFFLHFAGDEARDQFRLADMVAGESIILTGTETTIGNFTLGPLYYYLLLLPHVLSGGSPVAAGVLVAVLDSSTVFFLYAIGRTIKKHTGIISAVIYAVLFWAVRIGSWAWNPNITPLLSSIIILLVFRVHTHKKIHSVDVYLLMFTSIISLHFHAQMVWVVCAVSAFLIATFKKESKGLITPASAMLLMTYAPWIIFEVNSGFQNTRSIYHWITATRSAQPFAERAQHAFYDFNRRTAQLITTIPSAKLGVMINSAAFIALIRSKKFIAVFSAAMVSIFFMSFFITAEKKYLHFIVPLLPVFSLSIGIAAAHLKRKMALRAFVVALLCATIVNAWLIIIKRSQIVDGRPGTEFNVVYGQKKEAALRFIEQKNDKERKLYIHVPLDEEKTYRYIVNQLGYQLENTEGCNSIEEIQENKRYDEKIGPLGLEFCDT